MSSPADRTRARFAALHGLVSVSYTHLLISLCLKIMAILITVILYGRMIEIYCTCLLYTSVVAVYQDDGYTGLNMERPDLKRMLKAIERRQINLVITKDLSRLGRNYLQTGTLIEDFFPRHGVRYIAMNDGIDTMRENNDIAPFKNILNEMYSKDISKKVHSSYLLKAQKGQFTGCLAPFGYQKDPDDKNHLLIDEETAPIVRRLFAWALEGHGPNYIRRRLEEEKIPCPTYWNRVRGLRNCLLYTSKGVRYIAINDNVDTINGESELAPFLNILNEMHARQTSKKV